jgi:probable F420-dependent oxidoreductase
VRTSPAALGLMLTAESAREEVALAQQAEAAGFGECLAWEFFNRNAYVRLAAVAAATRRIHIGTGIATAFVRAPLVHAAAALDLDELSGGRVTLGLGSATRRMNEDWYGTPFPPPAPRIEELVRLLRTAFAAERGLTFEGKHHRALVPAYARPGRVRSDIPIRLAAVNRGMVEAAGRVADGLLGHPVATRRWHRERTLPELASGARAAGRAENACALTPIVVTSIGADREQARRDARQQIGFYLTTEIYHTILDLHGAREIGRACQAALRSGDLAKLCDAVPDDFLDELAIAGTPDDAHAALARWLEVAPSVVLYAPNAGIDVARLRANYAAIFATFGVRAAD